MLDLVLTYLCVVYPLFNFKAGNQALIKLSAKSEYLTVVVLILLAGLMLNAIISFQLTLALLIMAFLVGAFNVYLSVKHAIHSFLLRDVMYFTDELVALGALVIIERYGIELANHS